MPCRQALIIFAEMMPLCFDYGVFALMLHDAAFLFAIIAAYFIRRYAAAACHFLFRCHADAAFSPFAAFSPEAPMLRCRR